MNVFIVEDGLQTRKELADLLADENGFSWKFSIAR
jgi:hypothetical protein